MAVFVSSVSKVNRQWNNDSLADKEMYMVEDYEDLRVAFRLDEDVTHEITKENLFSGYNASMDQSKNIMDYIEEKKSNLVYTSGRTKLSEASNAKQVSLFDIEGIKITSGNHLYGADDSIPVGAATDIVIRATNDEENTILELYDHCLFIVDGYVRKRLIVNNAIFIFGAADALHDSSTSDVSVIDFREIPETTIIPFSDLVVRKKLKTMDPNKDYVTQLGLEATNTTLNGKYLIPVIAGVPYFDTTSFMTRNENTISIEVNHDVELRRLMTRPTEERKKYLVDLVNPSAVNIMNFDVEKYLSNGDSYLVVIDHPGVCLKKERLSNDGLVGSYYHYRAPNGIIQFENMILANYLISEFKPGHVRINCNPRTKHHSVESEFGGQKIVTAANTVTTPEAMSAYLYDLYLVR